MTYTVVCRTCGVTCSEWEEMFAHQRLAGHTYATGGWIGGGMMGVGNPATVIPSPSSRGRLPVLAAMQKVEEDNSRKGIGGAPTRATTLPTEGSERKKFPVASGVLDYFPDALAAVSRVSWEGNNQHNPGQPLHWDRSKSQDEADTLMRHFLQRGTLDTDGQRHSAKVAWRALAMLQKEIEGEQE